MLWSMNAIKQIFYKLGITVNLFSEEVCIRQAVNIVTGVVLQTITIVANRVKKMKKFLCCWNVSSTNQ